MCRLVQKHFLKPCVWAVKYSHKLKDVLKENGYYTGMGDEGGFAPDLKSNEEAFELIFEAVERARE